MNKTQLCYATWSWGLKAKEESFLAAKEISKIGYRNFESVKNIIQVYDFNVKEYKTMLDSFGLTAQSFYFNLPKYGEENTLFDGLKKELDFISELGVTRVTLQGVNGRPEGDVMDDASREYNLSQTIKFAETAKAFGIYTNIHPHTNTYIMYEDEIDYVLNNTDVNLVGFAPDTAHMVAAGGDAVEIIRRHAKRVNFTHLKDYRFSGENPSEIWVGSGVHVMSCFCELGDGIIDIPEIIRILEGADYKGPLCIELDRPTTSNYEGAKKNYEYLAKFLED